MRSTGARPKVAILREQGVNTHVEMSYAMDQAGFDTFDVHMTDLQAGRARLDEFQGFVACGGFSYGDTLGAGEGWARSILFNPALAEQFAAFFARADTFALGVCNGCQMMAALADDHPRRRGLAALHRATAASSSRRGSRWSRCCESPSIFFSGMAGSRMPIAVAHGEGYRRLLAARRRGARCMRAMRFVDNHGRPTEAYPSNPNGSPGGLTAVTTADGRFTALMPHPERVFRNVQMSWTSRRRAASASPWMRMFENARRCARLGRGIAQAIALPLRLVGRVRSHRRPGAAPQGAGRPNSAAPLSQAMRRATAGGRSPSQRRACSISAS